MCSFFKTCDVNVAKHFADVASAAAFGAAAELGPAGAVMAALDES